MWCGVGWGGVVWSGVRWGGRGGVEEGVVARQLCVYDYVLCV